MAVFARFLSLFFSCKRQCTILCVGKDLIGERESRKFAVAHPLAYVTGFALPIVVFGRLRLVLATMICQS